MQCKICNYKSKIFLKEMFDDRHGYPGKFKIYKCINCGFMQTFPQLTTRQLSNVYTNYYPKRDNDIKAIKNNSKKIPQKREIYKNGWGTTCHFQTNKADKVLDVGCGTCQSLLEIKRLGGEAWGIDPDQNSQRVAKKLNLKFHLGTIHNAKLPKKYFDLITASQVLEHENNPGEFLKKCSKYLKDDGRVILSFPNTDALSAKIWGKRWLHWHIPYHLNHFNKKSIGILVDNSDFKISTIETVTPNLWTLLQFRSYLSKPKVGKRNPMWDGQSTPTANNNRKLTDKIINYIYAVSYKFLFINRLIDKMGFGESFVVTLSKT